MASKKSYSDSELINCIRGDNNENDLCFEFIYRNYRPRALKFIIKQGGSREDAEDIFQEAMLRFIENVRRKEYSGRGKLKSYLFSICKFCFYEQLRTEKKKRNYMNELMRADLATTCSREEQMIKDEELTGVRSIFNELGETCRKLLDYAILQKKTMVEIATQMGFKNADTAKSKMWKCKQSFKGNPGWTLWN